MYYKPLVIADPKLKGAVYKIATGAFRKQETAVIQLPAGIGTIQGIYLSFASKERELYSGDQYFGI